jgi:ubiquinone/menaquinone biosynthesis C-methylase UbiE
MTDRWNRIIYRLWAPLYDAVLNRFFLPGRRRAMQLLSPRPGERLLLVGIGTGADLGLLPAEIKVIGTDLSPQMLGRAMRKLPLDESDVLLARSNAELPLLAARSMDAALLSLILSVVPDGRRCMESTLHALRPGARIVIFDKFLRGAHSPGWPRRLAGQAGILLGTDINRRLGDMTEGLPCKIQSDEPSIAQGMYRVILLTKLEM